VVTVSKEWTCEERLRVIAEITTLHLEERKPMLPMEMHLIQAAVEFSPAMLEGNRQAFAKYVEPAK
jgi:hypothetical protein